MEVRAKVDERGRIVIPAKVRKKMRIEPMTRVSIKIERVYREKSFLETAGEIRKTLKAKKDAVKLLHEESPFR
jgi:AbrB family looped-hinge helix DNA binding protein